jgi:hypothetical protein
MASSRKRKIAQQPGLLAIALPDKASDPDFF